MDRLIVERKLDSLQRCLARVVWRSGKAVQAASSNC